MNLNENEIRIIAGSVDGDPARFEITLQRPLIVDDTWALALLEIVVNNDLKLFREGVDIIKVGRRKRVKRFSEERMVTLMNTPLNLLNYSPLLNRILEVEQKTLPEILRTLFDSRAPEVAGQQIGLSRWGLIFIVEKFAGMENDSTDMLWNPSYTKDVLSNIGVSRAWKDLPGLPPTAELSGQFGWFKTLVAMGTSDAQSVLSALYDSIFDNRLHLYASKLNLGTVQLWENVDVLLTKLVNAEPLTNSSGSTNQPVSGADGGVSHTLNADSNRDSTRGASSTAVNGDDGEDSGDESSGVIMPDRDSFATDDEGPADKPDSRALTDSSTPQPRAIRHTRIPGGNTLDVERSHGAPAKPVEKARSGEQPGSSAESSPDVGEETDEAVGGSHNKPGRAVTLEEGDTSSLDEELPKSPDLLVSMETSDEDGQPLDETLRLSEKLHEYKKNPLTSEESLSRNNTGYTIDVSKVEHLDDLDQITKQVERVFALMHESSRHQTTFFYSARDRKVTICVGDGEEVTLGGRLADVYSLPTLMRSGEIHVSSHCVDPYIDNRTFYLYSDVTREILLGESYFPVLAAVPLTNGIVHTGFQRPIFHKLNKNHIVHIRLALFNEVGEQVCFKTDNSSIVKLLFRRTNHGGPI